MLSTVRFVLTLAWRDLRGSGRSLWVFCLCLLLGVSLVAATSGLYRVIDAELKADTRALLGGDVEVEAKQALPEEVLLWMSERGSVSLVRELYTMLGTADDEFIRVELQSMEANYPLYGELELDPAIPLADATAFKDQQWGIAVDTVLAERQGLAVGDTVSIGSLSVAVRAVVVAQPDRNLSAQWRGAPVLIADAAIDEAELTGPASRIDYAYKVATSIPSTQWQQQFYQRFGEQSWELQTFEDRSERVAERLAQIASGLILIAFSTLFVGGLGVYSSIRAHLHSKLNTIATLRSIGLRNGRLAAVYLLQIALLAAGASALGCLLGGVLAWAAATVFASNTQASTDLSTLAQPLVLALAFGLCTAFAFAMPAIGRALAVSPATLFRSEGAAAKLPARFTLATAVAAVVVMIGVVVILPSYGFALGFMAVVGLLLLVLDLLLRALRRVARAAHNTPLARRHFALRLALANLQRPESPLRSSLLSLGSALTVVVACTLVVTALLREVYSTIPQEAPALVLYDIDASQLDAVLAATHAAAEARIETAPLLRARLDTIRGTRVSELASGDKDEFREAINNEHKLSYLGANVDGLELVDGAWWAPGTQGVMSLEDREAKRLGVRVGDRMSYKFQESIIELQVQAIHRQKGLQTRFWFEAVVADGALDTHLQRYVGTVFMPDAAAITAQQNIAEVAPNVISVRTERLLASARQLLGQASNGLLVVASIALAASVLVLVSVLSAARSRQIYEATVLNSLGARMSLIQRGLHLEFALLAVVTTVFAVVLGSAIALPLLEWRLKLPSTDLLWVAALTAAAVASLTLGMGARYVHRRLTLKPALLLQDSA